MNDASLIQLKIIVERVVRPMHVSFARKNAMRRELLTHLISALEQEMLTADTESAALSATLARFGNPTELTEQLRQAVPTVDRFHRWVDVLWFRPISFAALARLDAERIEQLAEWEQLPIA